MTRHESSAPPMTMFEHWVADCSVKHQAAVRAARALDGGALTGRTAAEAEVSRLTVALIEKLHTLPAIVANYGVDEVFLPRRAPVSPEILALLRR